MFRAQDASCCCTTPQVADAMESVLEDTLRLNMQLQRRVAVLGKELAAERAKPKARPAGTSPGNPWGES